MGVTTKANLKNGFGATNAVMSLMDGTNGFQIKRLDPGYPLATDLRHLGLRAFLPGTRRLAPQELELIGG